MIQVSGLTRYFDTFCAVNDLSFEVKPGDILGFLGPNGAGKSTTMKMLTGFLAPSSGQITINQRDIQTHPIEAKRSIGYLPEGAPSYGTMTVYDFLKFIGEVRGFSGDELESRLADVVQKVELQEVIFKTIETLSKGFKRRVGIAQAIIHDPDILILDEPTDGLDPNQKHQVRNLIKSMAKEKIIIVSTHILEEVSAVCNRAMIIAHGKKLFDGTPEELVAQSKHHNAIRIGFNDVIDQALFHEVEGILDIETCGNNDYLLIGDGQKALPELVKRLNEQQLKPQHLALETGQLDEVFRSITRGV